MAMIQEKSTFASPSDLIDKIRVFLLARGWTVNGHTADGDGMRLHVSKDDMFVNLRSSLGGFPNPFGSTTTYDLGSCICLNGSDGYDGDALWSEQPGYPRSISGTRLGHYMPQVPTGAGTYWFFYGTSPDAFYCIIQVGVDQYRYLGFGRLDKPYSWNGGAYTMASYTRYDIHTSGNRTISPMGTYHTTVSNPLSQNGPGGLIRAAYDDFDGWLGRGAAPDVAGGAYTTGCGYFCSLTGDLSASGISGPDPTSDGHIPARLPVYGRETSGSNNLGGLFERAYNTANNVAILLPIYLYGRRMPHGRACSMLGRLPHVYCVNTRHLAADTVYTYGLVDYRVMPTHSMLDTNPNNVMMARLGLAFPV